MTNYTLYNGEPERRDGDYSSPWDEVRMNEGYHSFGDYPPIKEGETPGSGSMLISNSTEMVPIFLFTPAFSTPMMTREQLCKGFVHALRGDFPRGRRLSTFKVLRRIADLDQATFTAASSHGAKETSFSVSFLTCMVRSREMNNGSVQYAGPDFAWACVVPRETSAEFHYQFLNMGVISPDDYGLKFWYNPEAVSSHPVIRRVFRNQLTEQLGKLYLVGRAKTKEEMASLLIPYSRIFPTHSTIEDKRKFGLGIIHRAIEELAVEYPASGTSDREAVIPFATLPRGVFHPSAGEGVYLGHTYEPFVIPLNPAPGAYYTQRSTTDANTTIRIPPVPGGDTDSRETAGEVLREGRPSSEEVLQPGGTSGSLHLPEG